MVSVKETLNIQGGKQIEQNPKRRVGSIGGVITSAYCQLINKPSEGLVEKRQLSPL